VVIKNNQAVKARGIMIDITEHKKLREQLQHSQKMEAVGHLAGGVAHDFNNILTAITGYAALLQLNIDKDNQLRRYVDQIVASSERAANLTKSLLAFSRRQILNLRPAILHEIIENAVMLLKRVIREDIEIKTLLRDAPLMIMADRGQIEQVLINLATNAQDAMLNGGQLTIEAGGIEIDDDFIKAHGFSRPGPYALISVSDTGTGMDEKIREKAFEPFFTTKEIGKGTGLGLAIVYGIVKEHNGYITLYSEVGKGSTFKIYLPLIMAESEAARPEEHKIIIDGTETILVAEDDAIVRDLTKSVLEKHGYTVIEAVDGQEAVDRFKENKDKIHLSLLDVIMPKKNGKEVYDEIKKISPDAKALFMSGYTAGVIKKKRVVEEGLNIIFKPIPPAELLKKIREVLEI
jgi:nitrogen-specific signal transduction histidine kinase